MAQINPCLVAQLTEGFVSTVVDAATTTGVAKSNAFAVPGRCSQLQRSVNFQATGTYTVATLTLQQSFDGGNSWVSVGSPMDFFGILAGNLATLNGLVAFTTGVLYRLSVTTITGTSITVQLAIT